MTLEKSEASPKSILPEVEKGFESLLERAGFSEQEIKSALEYGRNFPGALKQLGQVLLEYPDSTREEVLKYLQEKSDSSER